MKKNLTLLTALLTLSFFGFAQHNMDMKMVNKALHQQEARATRNDIAPLRSIYKLANGDTYRDNFTYDEYEYYLTSVETKQQDQNAWYQYSLTTYEYDYNLMPIEILKQRMEDDWVNDLRTTITYGGNDFMPLIEEELFQRWENNAWVNISKNVYTYDPGITILVRDWNGNSFENHYLYTIEDFFNTSTILLQDWNGGAWINLEKVDISYNDNHEISQSITQLWINEAWVNDEKVDYFYNGNYKLSQVTRTLWENGQWTPEKVKTIDYEFDWMGSTHAICQSNYGGEAEQNTDIEMFYNEGESITYEHVNEVEMYYFDVSKVNDHPMGSVVIAPNPATDYIEVSAEHFTKALVYNLTGQKVMESLSPNINLKGLASGTYFIKVYQDNHAFEVQKFVVK